MEGEAESVTLRPLTKEEVMSLNNHSVTFEHARSLFGVDLPTFKAKLLEFDIFVWKDANGLRRRIHGGGYKIHIAIKKLRKFLVLSGTLAFSDVVKIIERSARLPPGDYDLTYEHTQPLFHNLLKTDRDWHYAVEYSKERAYTVRLDVKTEAPDIVARIAAYESEDASDCAPHGDSEIMLPDSDTKPSVPFVEDRNGSHKDRVIDTVEPSKTEQVSANVTDQGEEAVYVISVPSDVPLVENAETLLDDFKDHKSIHSSVPLSLDLDDDKDVEHRSMVDTFEVKTAKDITQESQIYENCESSIESAVSEHTNTGFSASVPALVIDASGVVSETVVNECDAKLMSSQGCGVDASFCSNSRNSFEGNWGSVTVLSTASTASTDAFGGPSLVEPQKEIDQNASEIKPVTTQISQLPKSEANMTNETEGWKRNEEAIAKVTNWTTNEQIHSPLKNLATEAKASNHIQLSTMIQKNEAAKKTDEPKKPNMSLGTTTAYQEPSPPKYIGEGKEVRKKAKGRLSWVPFMCCSSVNAS